MVGTMQQTRDLSARRIIGFACNQAFLFFLFYMGANRAATFGDLAFQRVDLLFLLLFVVIGFGIVRSLGERAFDRAFSRPLLYLYAIIAAAGSLVPVFAPDGPLGVIALAGLLTGVPCAFLLTAWGRSFGCASRAHSVPEVFLGSLVGALVCLAFSLLEASDWALLAMRALPLASVVNIEIPEGRKLHEPAAIEAESDQAFTLTMKILLGTFLYGVAAGVMDLYSMGGESAVPYFPTSTVVFGAFLIGGLSLLLSDGFGRGAALSTSYRLAVFVMMVGVLFVPVPLAAGSALPGQAILLAGYLGIEVVLVSLFVVMADLTATDCALSFSAGFLSLFAGELIGGLLANAFFRALLSAAGDVLLAVALAGVLILVGYVFLFTDRDFDKLSRIVSGSDSLERARTSIVERYGLSKREAEILAFALRGRTSERIAQELVIAKSTVDTHLRRIYGKCGVHSRQELLDLAEDLGA